MKRTEQLRADPAKTRAWQDRSRANAVKNAHERALGREGMQSVSLRRVATPPGDFRDDDGQVVTPKRKPLKRTGIERQLRQAQKGPDRVLPPVRFRARSPARAEWCARCAVEGRQRRATSWHHWLPQQHIRVYVRGLRLTEQTSRAELRKLLSDPDNLVALCTHCHDAHELRSRPLSGEEVPYKARLFALRLGPEWAERLAHMYPGGQRA